MRNCRDVKIIEEEKGIFYVGNGENYFSTFNNIAHLMIEEENNLINKNKSMDIKRQLMGNEKVEIVQTHESLENISKILKTEFMGIDEQIDMIINAIKPWLFFRETLGKPHIINLWGLTGCGKTRVIDRLIELLKLQFITSRLNGSELNNSSKYIGSFIYNDYCKDNHPIIIFDEFQNYRAKNKKGEEIEGYDSVIWDFIDTGIIKYNLTLTNEGEHIGIYAFLRIFKALLYLSKHSNITYKNGSFTLSKKDYERIEMVSNYDEKSEDDDKHHIVEVGGKPMSVFISEEVFFDMKNSFDEKINPDLSDNYAIYTFKKSVIKHFENFLNIYKIETGLGDDFDSYIRSLSLHDITDLMETIRALLFSGWRKPTFDLSKSLMFVIGNVDEAFGIHDDFNPDISANEFYKISKKVTIVNIKEALLKRFRAEHISRLGNIHVIFPSLNKKSFEDIIQMNLNNYSKQVKETYDLDLTYDKTINNILYKENVYPTLGARAVTSGMNDMIKANFANTLLYKDNYGIKCDTIKYSCHNKKILAEFYLGDKLIGKTTHEIKLRLENLRINKKDDKQSLVAVHESGHAVMRILLFKKLPVSICSVTADTESYGFMLNGEDDDDILYNRIFIKKYVMVSLGGRAAELNIFGWNMVSAGASADLSYCNNLLFQAYRKWGMMGDSLLVKDLSPLSEVAQEWEKDDIDKNVWLALKNYFEETCYMLKTEEKLLIALSNYLMDHNTISQKMIIKFIDEYGVGIKSSDLLKDGDNVYGYREKLLTYSNIQT
jgi:cell division protease FtsH